MRLLLTLLLASFLLAAAAALRPPEYDEAYSIFLTAGNPRPAWPAGVFHPSEVRHFFQGRPSLASIATDLRHTDVHPPLYFWALECWRRLFGASWFAARLLSVLFSIAALACLACLAALAEAPPVSALFLTFLAYGFAYTGIVARGFALAQAFNLAGLTLLLLASRVSRRAWMPGLLAGLAFGAAGFSNYLAVFVACGAFAWSLAQPRRRLLLPALLGFTAFLPFIFKFFRAQENARAGQFQPFAPAHATGLLGKDFGAALFGGLPLYAGPAGPAVTALLAALFLTAIYFIIAGWRAEFALFALSAAAVPAGLLALGCIFNNTPIEIRYLAFALPCLALLFAAALPARWRLLLVLTEACGFLGLIAAPATMQPQGLAARQITRLHLTGALVLLPYGNDGVGIPGSFIASAPDNLRLKLIRPGETPNLSHEQNVILVNLQVDAASTATTAAFLANLQSDPCWRPKQVDNRVSLFTRICTIGQ